jgi:cell division protease FtsH
MSFAPNPRYRTGMSPVARTVLFWALMVALASVLWLTSKAPKGRGGGHSISYSDFLQQVDKNNIATATFALSPNTADVSGNLREPVQAYQTTVPKENISDLMDRLRKQNANVEASESARKSRENWIGSLAPLVILLAFWIFIMMQRTRAKQTLPQNSSSIPPSNTPL